MGVTYNRNLGSIEALDHGQYTLETESSRAALRCALCGYLFVLPAHCRVELDGRVVPAIKCPAPGCSFFEYVTLADHWSDV